MDNLPTMSESSTFLRHISKLESVGIVVDKPLTAVVLVTILSAVTFISVHLCVYERHHNDLTTLDLH